MTSLRTPTFRLDGKTALITGAGRGLGYAAATALAEAGAECLLMSRTETDLHKLVGEIEELGAKAQPIVCDVTDLQAVNAIIDGLERLDVLINNAGSNRPQAFIEVSEENYDAVMNLNLKSAFFVAQAAARKMIAGAAGGSIVHISSQMGHVGGRNRSVYCASKHALEGLCKAMALELAGHNIRVNTICPTFIETPLTRPFFENPDFKQDTLSKIAFGRLGQLEELMGAVVYLASPASTLVTGSALMLDGGWTAQ